MRMLEIPSRLDLQPDDYRIYVLRLWRDNSTAPWRAIIDSPITSEHHAFVDLKSLFHFLEEATNIASEPCLGRDIQSSRSITPSP